MEWEDSDARGALGKSGFCRRALARELLGELHQVPPFQVRGIKFIADDAFWWARACAEGGRGGALVHEPLSKTFSGSLFSPLAFHYREVGRLRCQWNRADVI